MKRKLTIFMAVVIALQITAGPVICCSLTYSFSEITIPAGSTQAFDFFHQVNTWTEPRNVTLYDDYTFSQRLNDDIYDVMIMQILPPGWILDEIIIKGNTDGDEFIDLDNGMVMFDIEPGQSIHAYFYNNRVPIPSAVWLLTSGIIGLAGIRRFKK